MTQHKVLLFNVKNMLIQGKKHVSSKKKHFVSSFNFSLSQNYI